MSQTTAPAGVRRDSVSWHGTLKTAVAELERTPELGRGRHELPVEGVRTLNLRKYANYLVSTG
jgi:plasmid stabilization system protein ParE